MLFPIECPSCRQTQLAPRDMAGDYVRCAACGETLEVPEPRLDPSAAEESSAGPSPDEPPTLAAAAPIRFPARRGGAEEEMDLTPMVDVTFLLLIFFMVTAAFNMQKSFETPVAEESDPSTQARSIQDFEEDPDYVVVRIDEFNTYFVTAAGWEAEQETPSEQELLVKLREARHGVGGGRGATRMLVMAHGDALHQRVVTALDAGTAAGMEEVKLMTVDDDF